jgi:hypothetical protein
MFSEKSIRDATKRSASNSHAGTENDNLGRERMAHFHECPGQIFLEHNKKIQETFTFANS